MYMCKFGQNPSTGSEDNARNEKVDADGIPTQNNISPHPPGWGDNIMLVFRAGFHKMHVRIANREDPVQMKKKSDLGLPCLSGNLVFNFLEI